MKGVGYVVLTRDAKKDAPLARRLERAGVPFRQVPLTEHAPGPDRAGLPRRLREGWDWVVVTSPTAARFLLVGWDEAGRPPLRLAAVGRGTARVLEGAGLEVGFVSERAYGRALADTLPGAGRVLWSTSTLAGPELAETLAARGFEVRRLDVYLTRPRVLDAGERALLEGAAVAALGSPSAVRAWVEASGARPAVAAIGRVTGEAARAAGFLPVRWPEDPGVEGWALLARDLYFGKGHAP